MFDQFMGLLLLGLGIQSPVNPNVKGDTTENVETVVYQQYEGLTREEKVQKIKELKTNAQREREAYKARLKNARSDLKANIDEARDAYKTSLRDTREAFVLEVEARREEIKEQMQVKREAFEEKLKTIRDEQKRKTLENIQERLTQLNTKRTDAMTRHLNKMNEILERILEKVEAAKQEGKDTASVESAVAAADSAITAAQNAVTTQAGKSYVVTITTEENLKSVVESTRRQLEADLKATHALVVVARKAVSTAIQELAKVREEEVPEAVIK